MGLKIDRDQNYQRSPCTQRYRRIHPLLNRSHFANSLFILLIPEACAGGALSLSEPLITRIRPKSDQRFSRSRPKNSISFFRMNLKSRTTTRVKHVPKNEWITPVSTSSITRRRIKETYTSSEQTESSEWDVAVTSD
ncbi:unnamed protein product, partial [Nesidiocoris tenuis]